MGRIVVIIAAIAVAIGRLLITPRLTGIPSWEGSYEAAAHMLVGFLLLVAVYDWRQRVGPAQLYLALGAALSLLEIAMFLVQKAGV